MPIAKKDVQGLSIPAMNIQLMKVKINGTAPLIFHKWDEKAIRMILDKQMKKAQKGREVRDPEKEYESSFYYDSEGNIAFPARNIKQAIVGSARFINGVPMTILRGALFVEGDKDGFIPLTYKEKTMRQDMVTVGMGTADIRFRGQVEGWSMELMIKFDANILSSEQVLNLLQRAGFSQGLGEWRPERNGDNGTFEIETTDE
jgi:hypothetical protein